LTAAADTLEHVARRPDRFKASALLTALGIVYGDIGTSPLYVFQAIGKSVGGRFDEASALGSFSLIIWTLIIVVSLKYCLLVMRADNHGERGILALMSITRIPWRGRNRYLLVFASRAWRRSAAACSPSCIAIRSIRPTCSASRRKILCRSAARSRSRFASSRP